MKEDKAEGMGALTRREWLQRVPLPVVAASVGMGLLQETGHAESREMARQKAGGNDSGARIYSVRDYGAKGDGTALDTAAVQTAIDVCNRDGGGTVLIPAGTFQIGTVELKSNVTLYIAAGGKLLGSADGKQYHAVDAIPLHGDSTLEDGNWALLFAVNATNVTIEGPGTVDGQGQQFHSPVRGTPPPSGLGGNKRPYQILCHRCENLTIRNLDLLDCAYHSIRIIQSRRVHLDGIYIHNRVNSNNDGFHFISSEYVAISNCTVLSQDDACALFGSCRFVTVTNCVFSTRWSVFRFGGGTASNITVSNCVLYQVYGCPIKFHGVPGSRFENISFSNLILDDVTGPIHFSIGPRMSRNQSESETTSVEAANSAPPPLVRNISFSNIHGTVTTNPQQLPDTRYTSHANPGELHSCIALNCVGNAVMENISFSDVHLTFGGGGTAEDAARRDLPQIAGEYFMLGPMPAYGFYARNSRGLTLQNIRFQVQQPDLRPALILDHVEDVAISCFNVQANDGAESALRFIDTKDVLLTATRLLTSTSVFLQAEGSDTSAITIEGGDISKARKALAFRNGASEESVKIK